MFKDPYFSSKSMFLLIDLILIHIKSSFSSISQIINFESKIQINSDNELSNESKTKPIRLYCYIKLCRRKFCIIYGLITTFLQNVEKEFLFDSFNVIFDLDYLHELYVVSI